MRLGRASPFHVLLVGVLTLSLSTPVAAASLSGRISLSAGGQALRASELADAVVYFRPRGDFARPGPMPEAAMSTRRKEFTPRLLLITPGTSVRFPNDDPILHNAFSMSAGNTFDTGVYGSGEGVVHRFDAPGLVKVYCNVHHSMSAHILVLDTPWFVRPDGQGNFQLDGLPEGAGDLVVFHDRAAPFRQTLDPATATPLRIQLELTRRKVPPHMNKFGKPYGRASAGNY